MSNTARMMKIPKSLKQNEARNDQYPTALSLLNVSPDQNRYQPEDVEFILYFATLIAKELDLSPQVIATLKYGPLIGTSAKLEMGSESDEALNSESPSLKIFHYLSSSNSIFSLPDDTMFTVPDFVERLGFDSFFPEHIEELESEIDLALDVLMVAEAFNQLVSRNNHSTGCSISMAVEILKESPPENLDLMVVSALTSVVEKGGLMIH